VHFIDLDGFKSANDRFGHAVGDAILQEFARRLRVAVRAGDTAGRLGGDEFVVLQRSVTTMSEPEALGLRLVEVLSRPYDLDGERIALSASVGIAVFPDDGVDTKSLLHHADRALYEAKALGKSRATRVVSEPHAVSSVQRR
jgi:diguanylate cyclase (GGDEF)-like protein